MSGCLKYHFEFDRDEVFAGEILYLDQILENTSDSDIPFLQIETMLPNGLQFVFETEDHKPQHESTVQNVGELKAHSVLSRRWRVITKQRGSYSAEQVQLHWITNNPVGMDELSNKIDPERGDRNSLLVLPRALESLSELALSPTFTGTATIQNGIISDPMMYCGIRDYELHDPFRSIAWKQSARLGHLVVYKTETPRDDRFNIVLNMQSELIEPNPPELSNPGRVEPCISILASLLDSCMRRSISTKLIANMNPDFGVGAPLREDPIGRRIFQSETFSEKQNVMQAYRVLAKIPAKMSITVENLLDDILRYPECYVRDGNLILVTAFLNARMIHFHHLMKQRGYRVVFLSDGTVQNEVQIPGDVEVYFKYR